MDSVELDGIPYSVIEAIETLGAAQGAFREAVNSNEINIDSVFTTLASDVSPLSRYSPYSLLAHAVSGDSRTNENVQLAAISNVFSANHNALVDQVEASLARIKEQYADVDEAPKGLENVLALAQGDATFMVADPNEDGQKIEIDRAQAIFEMARTVNNAAYQRMIYDQYVVHLAGGIHFGISSEQGNELMPDTDKLMPQAIDMNEHGFGGVVPEVNPAVSLEFAGSAFRVGHSQIYPDLNGIKAEMSDELLEFGEAIERSLIEGFIQPTAISKMGVAAGVLAQNASDSAMAIDTFVVD